MYYFLGDSLRWEKVQVYISDYFKVGSLSMSALKGN